MEALSDRRVFRITLVMMIFCAGLAQMMEATVKIISPTKNQIIKYRNQSVLFNCTVTSSISSGARFQWLRNKKEIQPSNINNTLFWSSFELKNFTSQDEGEYVCIYGRSDDDSVVVHLASMPEARNSGVRSPVFRIVDETCRLQCEAEGWPKPEIFWMKEDKNISDINQDHNYRETPIQSEGDGPTYASSELTIFNIQKEDSGKYYCVATNPVGKDKYLIRVQAEDRPEDFKPTVTAEKTKYTVEPGKDVSLVCLGEEVQDKFDTFLFWELNGTKLNISSGRYSVSKRFTHQEDELTPKVHMRLTIFDVGYGDKGNYSCVVHAARRHAHDNITLEVKGKGGNRMEVWMILVLFFVTLALVLTLIGLIFLICRRHKRKKRMAKLAQKYGREAHDNNFEKDVFVSYSSKDYDWIRESLQPVFDQNNISYIIHSRDFKPGKAFFENMADSVYNSRKVILVMSQNYLSSGFCKDEMHMALCRSAQRDDGSLIVVKIDDMKPNDIPKSIRHKTFIDYASREETTTWQNRILEYVRSENRLLSVTSDENADNTRASEKIALLLNAFKLKKNKKQNVSRELADQS